MNEAKKVLIADDVEANRTVLNDFVVALGHEPVQAADGQQALDEVARQKPGIILLDILMPHMDGYEVLDRLKADDQFRDIPVIVISAIDELDSVVSCIEKGAEDYLVKPFNPVLLTARLTACLEKKRLRDREQQLYRELEASYDELQRAEEARDSLVHMIVHDLNNPLMAVSLGTQLALQKAKSGACDQDTLLKVLNGLQSPLERIRNMTADMLDVSKMEHEGLEVVLVPVPVDELAAQVHAQAELQAADRGKRMVLGTVPSGLTVQADRDLVMRIVQNLLTNAFKHTPSGGEVRLNVEQGDETVILIVSDDGEGIPPEFRERIFDKFAQVHARKEGHCPGVGLGLAFCKLAAEALGGRIWVESEVGLGSSFKLELQSG